MADTLRTRHMPGTRQVIAIAGPPGSSKSALSAILAAILRKICPDPVIVVGQDGWHYTNAYLDSHVVHTQGETVRMRSIKGAPETFDTQGLVDFLTRFRATLQSLKYPVYSRTAHDPIPEFGEVPAGPCLLILEGNYLLLDQPGWRSLHPLFQLTGFLSAPNAVLVEALGQRHRRGGKPEDWIAQHIQTVDQPNIDLVMRQSISPDFTIIKQSPTMIERITFDRVEPL
ncbi:MAG: hypothetical protein HY835_07225 [Anaerolineae bacterium]|nr:hypothetical protein [Anaerolineae bacterium]